MLRAAASLPGFVLWLAIVTVLAMGPLQGVDQALAKPWSEWFLPETGPLLADIVDPVASQLVAVPLLGIVALVLAWRRRSWRPILAGCVAELGVVALVGTMKLGFARLSPGKEDPAFFHGGVLSYGWHGISYPSGHAAEAVALYGAILFLILRYSRASKRTGTLLGCGAAVITVVTVLQSFYMGWHWMTDLLAGMLAGAVALRAAVAVDNRVAAHLRTRQRARPADATVRAHPRGPLRPDTAGHPSTTPKRARTRPINGSRTRVTANDAHE